MFLLLALVACAPTSECATLSVDDCQTQAGCTVVSGTRIDASTTDGGDACYEYGQAAAVACMDASNCFSYNGYSRDPSTGDCWYFPYGCGPEGWETCDPLEIGPAICE